MEDSTDQIEMLFSLVNARGHGGFNGTNCAMRYLTKLALRMEMRLFGSIAWSGFAISSHFCLI